MGNENSIFQECDWGDSVSDKSWIITHGTLQDGSDISLFSLRKNEKKQADLLRILTKQLRAIRHPCILHFIHSDESADGPRLMTESVVPLESLIPSLSAIEICAGLQNVLEGLAFLHDQAGACHNNLHLGSIYVAADGSWRLAGLEYARKYADVSNSFLETTRASRNEAAITPEEKEGRLALTSDVGHARDVYAMAVMVESFLEKMEDLGDLTKTFELRIQDECLHSNPKQRPKVQSLLSDRLFTTEFLQIATFLKNIILKTEDERHYFFKDLLPKLLKLPGDLIGKRLVPSLLSRFVMLDQWAVDYVLPSLLIPCPDQPDKTTSIHSGAVIPLLHKSTFQQYVVPKLVKMFCVHDLHIRIILLTYFPDYVPLINKDTLEYDIFPQVLLGLRDTSNTVAALSLHALAEMVPILGRDVIIGGRSKTYFKEGMPKKASESQNTVEVGRHGEGQRRPANVREVMGRTKLKDLVSLSENNIKETDEEKERKWKEREKKREEMRLRREERKQAREKKKLEVAKSAIPSCDGVIEEITEQPESAESPSFLLDIHTDSVNQSANADSETVQSDDGFLVNTTQEGQGDDWSDWEDDAGSNSAELDKGDNSLVATLESDSDISEDIEAELNAMESVDTKLSEGSVTNVIGNRGDISDVIGQADSRPTSSSSSVSTTRTGKKLQLKSSKKSKEHLSKVPNYKCSDDNKDDISYISRLNNSPRSDQTDVNTDIKTKHIPQNKAEALGSYFDISALEIKVAPKVSDPDDFFADMAPKIEIKPSALLPGEYTGTTPNKGQDNMTEVKPSLNFDIQNVEDTEEGDGWGDDDW